MDQNFWDLVREYSQLGFDPLRWIPTCSNEVDSKILQYALNGIKRSSIKLLANWFDAFYYADGKIPELTRRVYSLSDPATEKEVEIKRALSLFRIHTEIGDDPAALSRTLQKFLKHFHSKLLVRKNTMILTSNHDSQFALFDYIELHRGDKVGFTAANNSALQVTDPTLKPESETHSNIALTTAIENLNLLGCTSGFRVFPIYDAPSKMLDRIGINLDAYASRYNLAVEDYSSLKIGKFFFGATAIANTLKELPIRYDQIEEGMKIILSNKFGAMSAVSLHMLTEMDHDNIANIERKGILLNVLSAAKDETIKSLSEPHFSLGKIISKYCPNFGLDFDKHAHIIAVYPVSTDGIFALEKLAQLTDASIVISDVPMKNEAIARYVTEEFLMENATSSSTSCHLIVAAENIANLIVEELRKTNFDPTIIGSFSKKGTPHVEIENNVNQYLALKAKMVRPNPIR